MASVFKPKGRTKYRIEFKDEKGQSRTVPAFRDKKASQSLAAKLEEDAERLRAGLQPLHKATRPLFSIWKDRLRPMEEVRDAYLAELVRRGSDAEGRHCQESRITLNRILKKCKWELLEDLKVGDFTEFLGRLAVSGRAPRTQNRYFETLRNL